ncbi:MAG: chromosomal replication initiator protein [Parcubacteria group bacterium Gr01-1014_46]|nr:MAG: chromosomal replication initiator protein [Parcubacteria group bacterium Gr01-1014_46]
MMENKKLWDGVLVEMELNLSKPNFNTWFKDTFIVKQENGAVHLGVPNTFVQDWLSSKFHNTILKALRNISSNVQSLHYTISREDMKERALSEKPQQTTRELPIADTYINKEDNLNPRYTFDTFVVGPFNEFAHAASQAVIKKPGIVYNPLFVYGGTGHGKTHLIQAMGNYLKSSGNRKVFYTTSEKFSQELVNAIQANRPNFFKEKYRKYDVLIMDDVQFFSGKMKTQEELFHLFNHLYENNKQIIFSSDKHPALIQDLEDRLKSRFSAGMTVDIPTPDNESRIAIIRAKLNSSEYPLSKEVIEYLAYSINGNIRELEGIINSITCQSQLKGRELSLSEVKNFVKNNTRPKKIISIKEVVKTVSDFYNIEEQLIYDKTRKKEIIKPRQIIMYILREDFNISFPAIGEKLGGRDHTTVMHSCEKIKNDVKTDELLLQEINQLRSIFV